MRGAAVTLARQALAGDVPEAIVATDMLDLASFLAFTRGRLARVPALLYMHENQLTYPLRSEVAAGSRGRQASEPDRHYGFINLTSMLAADRVAFNSEFHRRSVLEELPRFLRHFPEHREEASVQALAGRACVLPVGIAGRELGAPSSPRRAPPLVMWNQRWEYDKNPAAMFDALRTVASRGIDFRVALCGQRFARQPAEFETGIADLGERVVHAGHLPRDQYVALLRDSDVVISTSYHEFFGIAVLEAIAAGAVPLLPARLSYPELLPTRVHDTCLYRDPADLADRLAETLALPERARAAIGRLAEEVIERFDWSRVAPAYDAAIEELVERGVTHGIYS